MNPRIPVFSWLAMAACLLGGCSGNSVDADNDSSAGGTYNDRLSATKKEFAYYAVLDQNLSQSVWRQAGLALRVPLPFQPADAATSQDVLGVALPGVLGVWKAQLPAKDGTTPESAYLFLMSNQRLRTSSPAAAMAFQQTLVEEILVELPERKPLPIDCEWSSSNLNGHGLPYTSGTFEARLPGTKTTANFTLFLLQYGSNERRDAIKVAMLFVIPTGAQFTGSGANVDPMELSAETLLITPLPKPSS